MFTAVTVAFGKEKPLLRLQARSLDRFVDWVDDIILIDNEPDGCNLTDVIPWFGRHAGKVRVLSAFDVMGELGPSSYYNQMALKILVHRFCKNDDIMILDSKNWFIKTISIDRVLRDGKYLTSTNKLDDLWYQKWINSLRLLNLDVKSYGSLHINCQTPFFVGKPILTKLDQSFNIKNLISMQKNFTEFCLINSIVLSQYLTLDSYFHQEETNGYCMGIWSNHVKYDLIPERLIGKTYRNQHVFCTGMHRNVWATIDQDIRNQIVKGLSFLDLMNEDESKILFDEMTVLNPINR